MRASATSPLPSTASPSKPGRNTQNRKTYLTLWQSAEEARIDRTMLIETIHQDDMDKMDILAERLMLMRVQAAPRPRSPEAAAHLAASAMSKLKAVSLLARGLKPGTPGQDSVRSGR